MTTKTGSYLRPRKATCITMCWRNWSSMWN